MHNLYISELVYLWPEVRPDSWSLHYKPIGKYWNAPCFDETSRSHPILSWLWRIISSVMIQVSFTDRHTGKGHLRSCEVISSLLPINHNTMMLKTCKRYQTAHLVKTRRLTCNMTITPAPYWVMTWPRPEVKFKLTNESHHTRFESSRRENHNGANPMSIFLSSKVI